MYRTGLVLGLLVGCALFSGCPPTRDRTSGDGGNRSGGMTPDATQEVPMASTDLLGFYEMRFEPGDAWHSHSLEIETVEPALRGRVVIDRGIGPQGRMPNPDEEAHLLGFEATSSGEGLEFTVECGALHPLRYSFKLQRGADGSLTGSVDCSGTKMQVVCTPAEAPVEPGRPSWDMLPRSP